MPVLVTKTIHGRRAIPIDQAELDRMLAAGAARKVNSGGALFEQIDNEDDCPIPIAPIYETKVMVADTPKRRGRPPKVANNVDTDPS